MTGIIFCKNIRDGNEQLLNIARNYSKMQIEYELKQFKAGYILACENGDYWKVVSANTLARGHRCNIAYIQRNIDIDTYYEVIAPCLTCLPYSAIRLFGEGNLRISEQPMPPFN